MKENSKQPQKTIDLPAPPSSWMELTENQLREVHRLMKSCASVPDFKLQVLMILNRLRMSSRGFEEDEEKGGGLRYLFRRIGWWNRWFGPLIGLSSWEVCFWADRYLKFLDEPMQLLALPFEHIRIGLHRYKAPDPQMVNLTYEQYGNAQRYLVAYWDARRSLAESDHTPLRQQLNLMREAEQSRAGFLAHLFTPPSLRLLDQRHQATRFSPQRVYHYDADRAERLIPRFRRLCRRDPILFDMCSQFFQSCQLRYKEDFPFLFKEYGGGDDRSALVMEIDTVNAVQKYAGYTTQQEVYDSNSVFIFGFLNNMAHEAKQIEEMNAKMKMK